MAEAERPFVQAEAMLLMGKSPMAGVLEGVLAGMKHPWSSTPAPGNEADKLFVTQSCTAARVIR